MFAISVTVFGGFDGLELHLSMSGIHLIIFVFDTSVVVGHRFSSSV